MRRITSLVLALMLVIMFAFPNEAFANNTPSTVTIQYNAVRLRSGPNLQSSIVTLVNSGAKYTYLATSAADRDGYPWYKIQYSSSQVAYVRSDLAEINYTQSPAPAPAPANSGKLTVNAQIGLNMRTGPGTNYAVITTIAHGTKLNYSDIKNNWYAVSYNNRTGWISGTYVNATPDANPSPAPTPTPTPDPTPTPTPVNKGTLTVTSTIGLNVRSLPSTNGVRLGALAYNATANYIDYQNGWYQIHYGSGTGWVSGDWVKTSAYVAPAPGTGTNNRQEAWLSWAEGRFIDRENDGVSWCTELSRQYAMDLFGTEAGLHMGNGNQQLYTGSSTYFQKIHWNRNDPSTYPQRGDIITWSGVIYPEGHAAIVLEAQPDPNGRIKVLTTSWGSPYTVAQVVYMAYSDAINGTVVGMLRPIQSKINATHSFGTR